MRMWGSMGARWAVVLFLWCQLVVSDGGIHFLQGIGMFGRANQKPETNI
jgi:hypothetical protein